MPRATPALGCSRTYAGATGERRFGHGYRRGICAALEAFGASVRGTTRPSESGYPTIVWTFPPRAKNCSTVSVLGWDLVGGLVALVMVSITFSE